MTSSSTHGISLAPLEDGGGGGGTGDFAGDGGFGDGGLSSLGGGSGGGGRGHFSAWDSASDIGECLICFATMVVTVVPRNGCTVLDQYHYRYIPCGTRVLSGGKCCYSV